MHTQIFGFMVSHATLYSNILHVLLLVKSRLETLVHVKLDAGLSLLRLGGGGAEDAVGVGDSGTDVLEGVCVRGR